ncbi:hypothetical protein OC834_003669 [Tilletia horrida]|nr:hypothetical protein OC834_003669 [Tilletia horrida]
MASSNNNSTSQALLLAKYRTSVEAIFLADDIHAVSSNFRTYYANSLYADTPGGPKDARQFLASLLEMRAQLSDIRLEYVHQIVSGRNVGSFERLTAKGRDGQVVKGNAIIFATFGEEGTPDEDKIVAFRETLELA